MVRSFAQLVMFWLCIFPTEAAELLQIEVQGPLIEVGSGGHYDGGRNPGCQAHLSEACVKPQHGGKLIPGTGRANIVVHSGNAGSQKPTIDTVDEFCIALWASTGACEMTAFVRGAAVATEEYQKTE